MSSETKPQHVLDLEKATGVFAHCGEESGGWRFEQPAKWFVKRSVTESTDDVDDTFTFWFDDAKTEEIENATLDEIKELIDEDVTANELKWQLIDKKRELECFDAIGDKISVLKRNLTEVAKIVKRRK